MNIHEKQNDYVTYLVASVRVAGGDGRSGPRVVLTPRVLAISSATGDFEVLDHETAKLVYPGGIVSPELRRVYDEIVAGTDPNDGVFLGLSPNIGIRRTTVNGVIQENEED
jgi:hypothetical protein